MFQKLFRIRPLMVVLYQHGLNETMKFFSPFLGLETRWRISEIKCECIRFYIKTLTYLKSRARLLPWNEEKSSHWVKITKGRLTLRHLKGSNTERPKVRTIIVSSVGVFIARNDFGRHPVGCSNKCVSSTYSSIQLRRHTEIHCRQKLYNNNIKL